MNKRTKVDIIILIALFIIGISVYFIIYKNHNKYGINRSCLLDSDCAVMNVTNSCGEYPSCVNKNSKIDYEAIRKDSQKQKGLDSVCGFAEIDDCRCELTKCKSYQNGNQIQ